ncbi:MAG: DUF4373 domain-containing protein [Desulfovibrionaceae bacterium]|nr:DUF4373 domain-containing protein [Desulfovibrionaceae bacterium]
MKWFKHHCSEKDSEVMARIEAEFGFEGVGRYWRILEIVGSQMMPDKNWAEFPTKFWQSSLRFSPKKLQNFLGFLAEFSNLTIEFSQKSIRVDVRNCLGIQDNWVRGRKKNSGVTPEKLRSKDKDIE